MGMEPRVPSRGTRLGSSTLALACLLVIKAAGEEGIDLTPRCAEAIREELSEAQNIDPDRPIFGAFDFHQEWDDEEKGGIFGRALTMADIDRHGLTPNHVTRHTAATLALENGVSILGAMAQGGWDSMSRCSDTRTRSCSTPGRLRAPAVWSHGRRTLSAEEAQRPPRNLSVS